MANGTTNVTKPRRSKKEISHEYSLLCSVECVVNGNRSPVNAIKSRERRRKINTDGTHQLGERFAIYVGHLCGGGTKRRMLNEL